MAKQLGLLTTFYNGISSQSIKLGKEASFAFSSGFDFRSEPTELKALPGSVKISGSIVTDLPLSRDLAGDKIYMHGNTGNIYVVDTGDNVSLETRVSNSRGNGLSYLTEDRYLYIFKDTSIDRRQDADSDGNYFSDFLENEGGTPTNTNVLSLNGTSQYASRADTASTSITGDLTIGAYIKPSSLPTGTDKMCLVSKWNENGNLRSYRLEIVTTSAFVGDGSDGALTISTNTTESPIDANCTGVAGTNTLTVSNVTGTFAVGQMIGIYQMRGTGAGQSQKVEIIGVSGSTLTLADNLLFSPQHSASTSVANKAQVRVLPQYTNVTVNAGITYTAKAWDGLKGGVLAFLYSGTLTVNGTIQGSAKGFRGGAGKQWTTNSVVYGDQGEGTSGLGSASKTANGNGGGGGQAYEGGIDAPGGGGGNGTGGSVGDSAGRGTAGQGGLASGTPDLTILTMGGGGGGGVWHQAYTGSDGGRGGAIIDISGDDTVMGANGFILSNGEDGEASSGNTLGSGGGGAGGSIKITSRSATLGTNRILANPGSGASEGSVEGGDGAYGRIHLSYDSAYTGSTTPTLNVLQNDDLGDSEGHGLRLSISDDGTNTETYTQSLEISPLDLWTRYHVVWDASASEATFYRNGIEIGQRTGSMTSIDDNASAFAVGASFDGSGSAQDLYAGLIDDVRVYAATRTSSQINSYKDRVLTGLESGLVAYYKFDGDLTDSQTSGNNNLTGTGTPTYSTDVPFAGVTSRGDEDVFLDKSGDTYALGTSISETSANKISFTPTKEPLKSIALNINTVGSGDWTIVIHDSLNRELVSLTVDNADLHTGVYEFIFDEAVRPVRNAEYHIHVYSSVADGVIVSSSNNDASTAYLKTYFQILVNNEFHHAIQFTNFIAIGNGRYLATLEAGAVYNPHRLVFPSGYEVRTIAVWGEFLAIGVNRNNRDEGIIFFWDGSSDTYSAPLYVPQGKINSIFGIQDTLFVFAGTKGKLFRYTGASDRSSGGPAGRSVVEVPKINYGETIEISPYAVDMYQSIMRFGAAYESTASDIYSGIYSYGHKDSSFEMSLGFDNLLSPGLNPVLVGSLITRNSKMYAGWQYLNSFGIDMISEENDRVSEAGIDTLLIDASSVPTSKFPLVTRSDHSALTSGQSVLVYAKFDRNSEYTLLGTQNTEGATHTRVTMNKRVKEFQVAYRYFTNGNPLSVRSVGIEIESEDKRKL